MPAGTSEMKALEILLTVAIILSAVAGVLGSAGISIDGGGIDTATTVPALLDPDAPAVRARGPLPANVEIVELQGAVRIDEADTIDHVLLAAGTLPAVIVALLILVLLRRVVRSVRAGDPFVPVNARRLQIIGWALVCWPLAVMPGSFAQLTLADRNGAQDVALTAYELPVWPIGVGLIVLVLARVFATGARLRDDVEGLV
jgi:hypothetical protein